MLGFLFRVVEDAGAWTATGILFDDAAVVSPEGVDERERELDRERERLRGLVNALLGMPVLERL